MYMTLSARAVSKRPHSREPSARQPTTSGRLKQPASLRSCRLLMHSLYITDYRITGFHGIKNPCNLLIRGIRAPPSRIVAAVPSMREILRNSRRGIDPHVRCAEKELEAPPGPHSGVRPLTRPLWLGSAVSLRLPARVVSERLHSRIAILLFCLPLLPVIIHIGRSDHTFVLTVLRNTWLLDCQLRRLPFAFQLIQRQCTAVMIQLIRLPR